MSDDASQVGEIEAAAYEAHRGYYRTACEWLDQATLMVVTAASEANRRPAQPDKAHGLVLHQTIAIVVRAVRSLRLLVTHGYPIEAVAMLRLATEAEENFAHLLKDRSGKRALRWGVEEAPPKAQPPPRQKPRHHSYHMPAHANTRNTFRYVQALPNGELMIDGGPSHNDNQLGWAVLREGASELLRVAAHIETVWQVTVDGREALVEQVALSQRLGRTIGELLTNENPYAAPPSPARDGRDPAAAPRNDAARTHRGPEEIERKFSLLQAAHVAPLTAHVEKLRAARGADRVPYFDPTEAGTAAPILLLLEAPGAKATRERGGSGFVSPDNNDGTAQNMWELLAEAGYDRATDVVTWNIVPWYIGSDSKIRPADSDDLLDARPYLEELLTLLPDLCAVVLFGKHAARGWRRLGLDLPTVECPHPSPQNLNSRPHLRPEILAALREARTLADLRPGVATS